MEPLTLEEGNIVTASTPAQRLVGDLAPKLADLTDDALFGDVWERAALSSRDRSLITCAALITNGSTEQLVGHLGRALDNGVTIDELAEATTHLAFYAGWPRAMSAVPVLRRVKYSRAQPDPSEAGGVDGNRDE